MKKMILLWTAVIVMAVAGSVAFAAEQQRAPELPDVAEIISQLGVKAAPSGKYQCIAAKVHYRVPGLPQTYWGDSSDDLHKAVRSAIEKCEKEERAECHIVWSPSPECSN